MRPGYGVGVSDVLFPSSRHSSGNINHVGQVGVAHNKLASGYVR